MSRISGVDIPKSKNSVIGLTYLYGIGRNLSKKILFNVGIDENKKVKDWSDEEISILRKYISNNVKIEGELRSEIQMNIKRLMDIGCYIGTRHRKCLPLRGQKTKNNCRTRKGKRKTVANKKKVSKN
ncbi:30S ribosomal protein S13 [Blattabacterium cuenoti]|uniref:30S ribosomal protein S13 n=1 Tax=Blattabacterium cuenoti TaxID=1653831 RepID=UPI00163CB777|nr:30S ribosomal protein S13 [Blattabacterium cuenoti]